MRRGDQDERGGNECDGRRLEDGGKELIGVGERHDVDFPDEKRAASSSSPAVRVGSSQRAQFEWASGAKTINNGFGPTSCYHSLVWTQTDHETAYADFPVLARQDTSHPGR